MKTMLAAAALLLTFATPSLSAADYVYPAQVEILASRTTAMGFGNGQGNVSDPSLGERAFDFAYSLCAAIPPSGPGERYAARWQATDRLELRYAPPGAAVRSCILRVTPHKFVYIKRPDGAVSTIQPKPYTP